MSIDEGIPRRTKSGLEPSSILFVENLSFTTTKNSLMKAFNGCVQAKIMVDEQTGKSIG